MGRTVTLHLGGDLAPDVAAVHARHRFFVREALQQRGELGVGDCLARGVGAVEEERAGGGGGS